MIAAIQLLEYLHTHWIYVTLYNVNTWSKDIFLWMLENKLIYPPKKRNKNKNLLSAARITACTIKVSLTERFLKTTFHRWKKPSHFSLTHSCTLWFNRRAMSLTVNVKIKKDKPLLMIVFDIISFFPPQEWDFKKVRIYIYIRTPNGYFCISKKQHTVCAQFYSSHSCPFLANEWITPAFTFVQWKSIWWYSLFWTPAKKHLWQN